MKLKIIIVVLLGILASCASVSPSYSKPQLSDSEKQMSNNDTLSYMISKIFESIGISF